jgi:hypothetical protein
MGSSNSGISQVSLTKEQKEKIELEKQKRKLEKEKEKQYENELKEKIKRDKESKRRELESDSTPKSPTNQTPFSSLPNNNKKETVNVVEEKATKKVKVSEKEEKKTYNTTEIAFRLPDGEVVKCGFKPSDLLSECREFVNSNFKAKKYEMLCVFPRRTYNSEDLSKSLQKLNLVPNGTIILSPGSSFVSPTGDGSNQSSTTSTTTTIDSSSSGGFLSSICPDSVTVVFTSFYDSVMGLFGSTQVPTPVTTQQQRRPPVTTQQQTQTTPKNEEQRTVVRRGNVHRFEDTKEEDSKKEKFNNGNSTQFQDE